MYFTNAQATNQITNTHFVTWKYRRISLKKAPDYI